MKLHGVISWLAGDVLKACSTLARVVFAAASLHTPLPAQNLIVNPDFEQGNTGFTSDYVYSSLGTSNLGIYSVVSDPKLSQTGNSSLGDHTSGTGLMLHANGSSDTNLAVWRQTVSVLSNRLYFFSGWGATSARSNGTSNDPNPAIMKLFVNGQALQTGAQPPATSVWAFFSRYWHSGTDQQALLEIRDGERPGIGNDFNLDDLSFRALDSSNPMASASPFGAPGQIEIQWNSGPGQVYQIQWSPDLDPSNWLELGAPLPASGGVMSITDSITPFEKRFYRVQIIKQNPLP
jgi:hypothetical protein